jgi:hypothetical protein
MPKKEAQRQRNDETGEMEPTSIRKVIVLRGSLSIERMCKLVSVSHRSFYRSLKEKGPVEEEIEDCPEYRLRYLD